MENKSDRKQHWTRCENKCIKCMDRIIITSPPLYLRLFQVYQRIKDSKDIYSFKSIKGFKAHAPILVSFRILMIWYWFYKYENARKWTRFRNPDLFRAPLEYFRSSELSCMICRICRLNLNLAVIVMIMQN